MKVTTYTCDICGGEAYFRDAIKAGKIWFKNIDPRFPDGAKLDICRADFIAALREAADAVERDA